MERCDTSLLQDFDGQGKAENISRIIITLCGVIGFIYGGYVQQFSMTVYFLGAGFALASLVSRMLWNVHLKLELNNLPFQLTVPPWPCYRKKALSWQKARYEVGEDGKPKEKEAKKK